MKNRKHSLAVLAAISLGIQAQTPSALQIAPEPKTAMEWFQNADRQMNLRMPGSAPFHMKATFHAFPGKELPSKKEQPQIVSGDGVYEETWLSPHKWRREVTLGGYHAIEVETENGRRMQASSDYEPSRVLMLLRTLLAPIPRSLVSDEFQNGRAPDWRIDHITSGNTQVVRISETKSATVNVSFSDALFFLPGGVLVLENNMGFVSVWGNDVLFGGKLIPRHISVKAGDRELVAADVTIGGLPQADSADFDLPVNLAEPGMTLRPIMAFNAKLPQPLSNPPLWDPDKHSVLQLWGVIDRAGRYRELEVVLGLNETGKDFPMDEMRKLRWRPAEIDGSPCEMVMPFGVVASPNTLMYSK